MTIWGNHSSTQFPDFYNATINGKPATEVITDTEWLENTFIPTVQKRGAAIIEARGASSAASAANAAIETVRNLVNPTPAGDWFSVGVVSKGEYGTVPGIITGFPIRTKEDGTWEIVAGLKINDFARAKIDASIKELCEERDTAAEALGCTL
jgi:malate dehydrogenase